MPVIPATQDAEIRKIAIQSQPRQIVLRDLISKKPFGGRNEPSLVCTYE
jgi:hypothetical protein